MANKRQLKKGINEICTNLIAECVANSLYGPEKNRKNVESMIESILKLQDHFCRRISHPEPGMRAKTYYNDLIEKFSEQAMEIVDVINTQ